MTIDLHGYHPAAIVWSGVLNKVVQQSWEMGEPYLYLIHGHGRNRGITPGFVNTNTGYFGLQIRHALRHDKSLRTWIYHTTLNCENMGVTWVRLKRNRAPSRSALDADLILDAVVESDRDGLRRAMEQIWESSHICSIDPRHPISPAPGALTIAGAGFLK